MVYQDLSLCDTIDVTGNLFLGREITRSGFLDRTTMARHAREMLSTLGIRIPNLSANVEKLSGGQRQSIAIARAASCTGAGNGEPTRAVRGRGRRQRTGGHEDRPDRTGAPRHGT